jgi:hypothetical protein
MRRWKSAVVLTALVAGTVTGPLTSAARASTTADVCGDAADADKDLASATLVYSASSFSVSTTACADIGVGGNWAITFHLTGFSPQVQVTAAFQDVGKYEGYSGYFVCAQTSCPVRTDGGGGLTPAGSSIEGPPYQSPTLYSPGRTSLGYGAWADVLPAGTAIPDSMPWYAEVRAIGFDGSDGVPLDRAPEVGTVDEQRNLAPVSSVLDVAPGPAPLRQYDVARRTDTGTLRTDSGAPIVDRLVQITTYMGARTPSGSDGRWSTDYWIGRNTAVTAYFPGDGAHEPARASYTALMKALVTLDLPAASTASRGRPLLLKGVVRPRGSGRVQVLIREDRAGSAYRLLRYTDLAQGTDSYYRISWTPTVRGHYVLRTRWINGSAAVGSALSSISTYTRLTVS